jgi:hypothetical protein
MNHMQIYVYDGCVLGPSELECALFMQSANGRFR